MRTRRAAVIALLELGLGSGATGVRAAEPAAQGDRGGPIAYRAIAVRPAIAPVPLPALLAPAIRARRTLLPNLAEAVVSNDPALGMFVDGVFAGGAQAALLAVSDIARVEVRSGPRAALGGRNTIGGNIDFITQRPSFERGGSATLRAGNYGLLETKLSLDVPLVPERLTARLSGATSQRDGYARNVVPGHSRTAGDDRMLAGRLQLLWNASENLELLFSADASHEPGKADAAKCKFVGFGAGPRGARPGPNAAGRRAGVVASTSRAAAPRTPEERDRLAAIAADAAQSGGELARACRRDDARGAFEIAADAPLLDEGANLGAHWIARWTPSDRLALTSISALRRRDSATSADGDATELPLLGGFAGVRNDNRNQLISQELTLSGVQADLKWTAGVYALLESNRSDNRNRSFSATDERPAFVVAEGLNAEDNLRGMADVHYVPKPVSGLALASGSGECLRFAGEDLERFRKSCLRSFRTPTSVSLVQLDGTTHAAYAEASYALTQRLRLDAGLRWTRERKRVQRSGRLLDLEELADRKGAAQPPFGLDGDPDNGGRFVPAVLLNASHGVFTRFDFSERFSGLTQRLALEYRWSDRLNGYLSFRRGFEPARFTNQLFAGTASVFARPETTTQYEAGLRSRWLDGRMTLNAAVFTSLGDDVQRRIAMLDDQGLITLLTTNVGATVIHGAELDWSALPLPGLILSSSLALRAGRYREFTADPSPSGLPFKDTHLPNLPVYTLDFTVDYSFSIGRLGDLGAKLTWKHEGTKGTLVSDAPYTRAAKHGTLGGRVALDLAGGATSLALFGSNLLDREYITAAADFAGSNGTLQRFYAPPRTYGIELTRRF